jgi:small subunit ribosomal protein S16
MRLRRIGTKGRPFYRVVIAPSTAGRNGKFVEILGTYDPIVKPTAIKINEERALHWLMNGAQPTETTAVILNKAGILEKFFEQRPAARKHYSFLDKRTAATSVASVVDQPVAASAEEETVAQEEAPAPEAVAEEAPQGEVPAAEEAGSDEAAPEATGGEDESA